MTKQIKKHVSILLSLIMILGMFTAIPLSSSAAIGDDLSEDDYLTFTAEEAGSTVTLKVRSGIDFQYDLNGTGLTDYTLGTTITLENEGDYVRFCGTDTIFNNTNHVSLTGKVACSGNVMSLRLNGGKVQGLATGCFLYMFANCQGLTTAPELPETTLANNCYSYMFRNCASLTEAPELPATDLTSSCYSDMFSGCTSLTELPELPATTLASSCYRNMFKGCSKICISEEAGTFGDITYSAEYRIPSEGSATNASNALNDMFAITGGKFTGTPSINTTYYVPAPPPPHTHGDVTLEPWESTTSLPTSGDYYLTEDVTVSSMTVIHDGNTLNLCLNGHSILMTGNDGVFTVNSNAVMNLYDCNGSDSVHYVTLENWRGTAVSGSGSATSVTNGNGTVEVTGGLITGGYAGNPGGGAFRVDGTFTMYGGTLIGNYAKYDTTKGSGGAVWSSGTTTIAGNSRITYNKGTEGDRGGVYISNGTFNISGTPDLTGNSGRDLVINGNSRKINFIDFDPDVRLGVIYYTTNPSGIEITTNADFADDAAVQAAMQHSNAGRSIVCCNGQAKIVNAYTVTWNNYNGSNLETDTDVAENTVPSYDGATPEKADDDDYTYTFSGWNDGTTTYGLTDALPEVTGSVTYTAVFEATPKPLYTFFAGNSVTVGGNIDENFFIDVRAAGITNANISSGDKTLTLTFAWKTSGPLSVLPASITVNSSNYDQYIDAETGYLKIPVEVCAAEMATPIIVTASANGHSEQIEYSVRAYVDTVPTDSYKEYYIANGGTEAKYNELVKLVKEMLNYGAKAQLQFGVDTDNLANAGITGYTTSSVDAETVLGKRNGTASNMNDKSAENFGLKYQYSTIVFLNKTTIRHYYTIINNDLFNARKTWASNTVAPIAKPDYGVIYFEIPNIPAAELDELKSFTFGGHTYSYSVLDYVAAVLNAGDMATPEEIALATATYWYNQAANTYFG